MSIQDSGIARSDLPIFTQDWWITIARGSSDYREAKVTRGNDILGRLPFVVWRNRLGLICGQDPYWSHLGGPILDPRLDRSEQASVIRSLLDQLPRWWSYCFVCDSTLSYADLVRDAFTGAGFAHSTQLTYVRFPGDGDILDSRKAKHRGHIRRAGKSLQCVEISANEFVQFFAKNLKAKGERSYAPLEILTCLVDEAVRRGRARVIAAKPIGGSESFDAAIIYVWDTTRCFYWLSTCRAPFDDHLETRPHPDAVKLLAVKAMEHAQEMGLIFDADGVATPGAENLYRNMFGLRTEEYRDVFRRLSPLERIYQRCRQKFKPMTATLPRAAIHIQAD